MQSYLLIFQYYENIHVYIYISYYSVVKIKPIKSWIVIFLHILENIRYLWICVIYLMSHFSQFIPIQKIPLDYKYFLKICRVLKVSSIVYQREAITIIQGLACIVEIKYFLCHMFCGASKKQQHYNEYLLVI